MDAVKTGFLQLVLAAALVGGVCAAESTSAPATPVAQASTPAQWSVDFDAAKAQAAREGKAVLLDFTGSDWCLYCKLLHKDVLDKPAFAAYARDKFVLVEVDLPNHPIDDGLRARNEDLRDKFHVESFPTLLVLSPQEEILGGFAGGGMGMGGVESYLDAAYANLAVLKAAQAATGRERARLFQEIYTSLDPDLRRNARTYKEEMIRNSAGGACALLAREEQAARQMSAFSVELSAARGDYRQRLATVSRQLEQAMPENKAGLMLLQSQLMGYAADSVADVLAAKERMLQAASLMPTKPSAARMRALAEKRYADPAAYLQLVRKVRAGRGGE